MLKLPVLMVMAMVFASAGCGRQQECGEYRTGRFSHQRDVKPNEIAIKELPGVYSCTFLTGRSEVHLSPDGTYVLKVFKDGKVIVYGPRKWEAYNKVDYIAVGLDEFMLDSAVMQKGDYGPGNREAPENIHAVVGVNEVGGRVLAIGGDPDNYYYFAYEKERQPETKE